VKIEELEEFEEFERYRFSKPRDENTPHVRFTGSTLQRLTNGEPPVTTKSNIKKFLLFPPRG